jgi:hypothetical protein
VAALPPRFDEVISQLRVTGLDLVTAFDVSAYNELAGEHPWLKPLAGFDHERACAVLIGNTRALWPALKRAVRRQPELLSLDPVDRHVETSVADAVQTIGVSSTIHYGHHRGVHMVSMLHAAEASGLAHLGPAYLAVHAQHGLWFAMRAVVVLDWPWEGDVSQPPDLCAGCEAPCVEALSAAKAQQREAASGRGMGPGWREWVKIRDVCPVGQEARYSDEQVRYHYTLDMTALRKP